MKDLAEDFGVEEKPAGRSALGATHPGGV